MNFRLAELARRFTDIINHLTDKPFTWGEGDGDLSDQTDLQEALDGKASLEGGNTFEGDQVITGDLFLTSDLKKSVSELSLLRWFQISPSQKAVFVFTAPGSGARIGFLDIAVAGVRDTNTTVNDNYRAKRETCIYRKLGFSGGLVFNNVEQVSGGFNDTSIDISYIADGNNSFRIEIGTTGGSGQSMTPDYSAYISVKQNMGSVNLIGFSIEDV